MAGHEEAQKRVMDPMFQLEHSVQDSKKGTEEAPQVHQLQVRRHFQLVHQLAVVWLESTDDARTEER